MSFDENIPGWLTLDEVQPLKNICSLVPKNSNVIEVGVFAGRGTLLLSEELPNSKIYSIDPWIDYTKLENVLNTTVGRRFRPTDVQKIFQTEVLPLCNNVTAIQGMFPENLNVKDNIGMIYFDTWGNDRDYNLYSAAWDLLINNGILCGRSFSSWGENVIKSVRKISRDKNVPIQLPPSTSLWYMIKK